MNNIVTLPKKRAPGNNLVVIPRKEYEALIELKKFREFSPTPAQKKALISAERNFRKRKTFSYHELVTKMGFAD